MNETLSRLLQGESENHLLPFFWQHGEPEEVLRQYVRVIGESGCGAFCVESRPHPDFCGPGWWHDLDCILDEAGKAGMKVWILDDSHFPTGYANGALKTAPNELHRQSICAAHLTFEGPAKEESITLEGMIPPEYKSASLLETYVMPSLLKNAPHFDDDEVIAVTAVQAETGETIFLPLPAKGAPLVWQRPEGKWDVWVVGLSRNCGPHREYINMLDHDSCKILLDAVYEPHYQHYKDLFGSVIAGFFSDEPELGNGHLYYMENLLGTDQDLPFARPLVKELETRLGKDWKNRMYLLWDDSAKDAEKAKVRYEYMDAVTKLVRENFSRQIGNWCRDHGVQYIGHVIEDDNAHGRTGASLGHYFRGLDGQDMSGVDDIGGQVLPQGEDAPTVGNLMQKRDGTFYHFALGNLAASAAAIQPAKHGNAMCEIFGNYGWSEGVRLEKYLADHMLVRGINWFVPHAFSPKAFPDPDCPPHFWAHGHNPQFRHFGCLVRYMNRAATLTSGGHRVVPVAVLYHAEAEWAGKAMLGEVANRVLAEAQIDYDTLPADVFAEKERFQTRLEGDALCVNTQRYRALVIPYAQFLPQVVIRALETLQKAGFPVFVLDALPEGVSDTGAALPASLQSLKVLSAKDLAKALAPLGLPEVKIAPASHRIRVMHYEGREELWFFVNEDSARYAGTAALKEVQAHPEDYCWYDIWNNKVFPVAVSPAGEIPLVLEPSESRMLIRHRITQGEQPYVAAPVACRGERVELSSWKRRLCEGAEYPNFHGEKAVQVPDHLDTDEPEFSGVARYETSFDKPSGARRITLEITDAAEGVEVFVNGKSAGIQIIPPFRYDLTPLVRDGKNDLAVEVATTLERECYCFVKDDPRAKLRGLQAPTSPSGLSGEVILRAEGNEE
jgi:hypothetical protein